MRIVNLHNLHNEQHNIKTSNMTSVTEAWSARAHLFVADSRGVDTSDPKHFRTSDELFARHFATGAEVSCIWELASCYF